ncbi:MAG: sulfatase-like hydrolase/transferase, partial [Chlorobiales bacterium]|nr:sulfatase-like hydrolase/transferase [Chlorobiales bacterium]
MMKNRLIAMLLFFYLPLITFASSRPNIILLVSDDQRRDQANFLPEGRGKNLTPNLDRLAAEGLVLPALYTPSTACVPSRFSLLTGNYAGRATNQWMRALRRMHGHTFVHQEPNVTIDTRTIAKDLKQLGYTTGAVGKNHVIEAPGYRKVDARERLDDPKVLERLQQNQEACRAAYHAAGFDFAERFYHTNPRVIGPPAIQVHNLDWINEAALKFIDQNHSKPFFLYYAVTTPHGPHRGFKSNPLATPVGLLRKKPAGLPLRATILERLKQKSFDEEAGDMLWFDDCVGSLLAKLA